MRPPKFEIRAHHREAARRLGVQIRPSQVRGKKLDVFKGGNKVASIGQKGYWDFASYKALAPDIADARRMAYRKRHAEDRLRKGSAGYYAYYILW